MVGDIDQPQLGIVKDGVRILTPGNLSEEAVMGEIENPNRIAPTTTGECEIQFRYERGTVDARKLAHDADAAAGVPVNQPHEIVAGERDVKTWRLRTSCSR
jgi:hypothetical protein